MPAPEPLEPNPSLYRRLGYWLVGMSGTLLTFLAVALLLVVALYLYSQQASSQLEQRQGIGSTLPDLALEPLTGDATPVTLADLKGKVVLVDFWGTWCPPCREELPHIADLAQEFAEEADFRVLAVSCGPGGPEDVEELRADTDLFLQEQSLKLPTYTDPQETTRQAFMKVAPFDSFPTLFLLDRDGVIRAIWQGYSPGLVISVRNRIRQVLDGQDATSQDSHGAPR